MKRMVLMGVFLFMDVSRLFAQSPAAVDDTVRTNPETAVTIHVLSNDSDPQGDIDPSSLSIVTQPTIGTAQLGSVPGTILYTPDAGQRGKDSLQYTVNDLMANVSNVATVRILINAAPVGFGASLSTPMNTPLVIVVTDHVFDADGFVDVSTTAVTQVPTRGSFFVDQTFGEITYTPEPGTRGLDSLAFVVSDNDGTPSNPVTVMIMINNPPIASPDTAKTARNTPVVINVLANDVDTDGMLDPSTVGTEILPEFGSVDIDPVNGAVTYTPNAGFSGTDRFEYFVADLDGGFSELTPVVVTVINADPPLAVPDEIISLGRNTPVTLDALENDSTRGVPFVLSSLTLTRYPVGGSAFIDTTTYMIRYVPGPDFEGPDTLLYTVLNDSGLTSNEGMIALTVRSQVNDSAVTVYQTPISIDVLANDEVINDFPPDPSTLVIVTAPSRGAILSVDTDTGSITYLPDTGFTGTDSLVYRVDSGFGTIVAVATAKIHVRFQPTAVDDSVIAARNDEAIIAVLTNDLVVDGTFPPASLRIETPPANGEATADTVNGRLVYFPNFDYTGPDSLAYSVSDNYGIRSNTATVRILVVAAEPPVAVDDSVISLGRNTPVTLNVLQNDSSGSLSLIPSTVTITRTPLLGIATVHAATGTIRYVPIAFAEGPDSLFYTVENDSAVVSNEAAVRLTIRSSVNDNAVTFRDSSVTVNVIANDSVEAGYVPDPSTIAIVEPPVNGSVTALDPVSGAISYAPTPGYTGPDSLIYSVENGGGTVVVVATLTISVRPPNQRPVASDDEAILRQNSSVLIDVLSNDTDPDNDALILEAVSDPPNGTAIISGNGVLYLPDMNFVGPDSLRYVIHDGFQGRDTAVVRIEVILLAYDITDLGTLGGTVSRAYGLNELNHVVGASTTSAGGIRPFLWKTGTLEQLSLPDSSSSQAIALTDSGLVVGVKQTNGTFQPAIWLNDSLIIPSGLSVALGAAFAVNSTGTVVGSASDGTFLKAFSWSGGSLQFVEVDARTSEAFAINAAGAIAGYVQSGPGRYGASRGTTSLGWSMIDSVASTKAFALNDSGYSAGSIQTGEGTFAAVWDSTGVITVLPGLTGNFGEIYSLNNERVGVGASGNVDLTAMRATLHPVWRGFLQDPMLLKTSLEHLRATIWIRGTPFDLNEAIPQTGEWILMEARGINDGSAIIGTGRRNGSIRGFLMTPSSNQAPQVSPVFVRVPEGGSVVFNVLQGAFDPDGELVRLVAVEGQKHGSVAFTETGQVTYTASEGFVGDDSLFFTLSDRSARTKGKAIISVLQRPTVFDLYQNHPNPFNSTTMITFSLPARQKVRLDVYDILGRRVAELVHQVLDAGIHEVPFHPVQLSSGVYFYSLSGSDGRVVRRLVLLK